MSLKFVSWWKIIEFIGCQIEGLFGPPLEKMFPVDWVEKKTLECFSFLFNIVGLVLFYTYMVLHRGWLC